MTPPQHLNLTMSSLGAESHHQPQDTQKQRKQHHTQDTQNKTNNTQEHYTCTHIQASTFSPKHSLNQK